MGTLRISQAYIQKYACQYRIRPAAVSLGVKHGQAMGVDDAGRKSYRLGMKAIISEKGQVTIPKAVRMKLGLRPGTVLEFEAERGRLVGRKQSGRDAIDEIYGSMKMDEPVDEYIERTRGR